MTCQHLLHRLGIEFSQRWPVAKFLMRKRKHFRGLDAVGGGWELSTGLSTCNAAACGAAILEASGLELKVVPKAKRKRPAI